VKQKQQQKNTELPPDIEYFTPMKVEFLIVDGAQIQT
jgi:hypothetical protein